MLARGSLPWTSGTSSSPSQAGTLLRRHMAGFYSAVDNPQRRPRLHSRWHQEGGLAGLNGMSILDAVDGSRHRHRDVPNAIDVAERLESAYGYKQT